MSESVDDVLDGETKVEARLKSKLSCWGLSVSGDESVTFAWRLNLTGAPVTAEGQTSRKINIKRSKKTSL